MALKRPIVDYYGNLKDMADGDYIRPSLLGSGTPSADSVLNGNGEWVSIASLNYWTLEAGNVYRATGKVFVGNQYDLGNYTFQVSGDTVTTGKINVGYVPNPSAQVEVYGGANFRYPSSDNNSLYVRMGSYISSGLYGTFLKSDSYYASTLVTNLHLGITDSSGTDKILITLRGSNSCVGINTVIPTERLEVGGLNAKIFVNGSDNLSNISLGRDDYSWRISNETDLRIYGSSGRTSSAINAFFAIANTTGNVGIGTTNPLQRLSVDGGNIGLMNGNYILFYNSGNGNYSSIRSAASGTMNFSTGGVTNAMVLTTSGKLLIGNTENGTKLLQINGGIRQNDVISGLVYADSLGQFVSAEASHITATLGDGYIKNQSSYDQVASFRINGTGIFAHSSPIRFDNAGNQDIHSNNGGTVRFINSAYSYANVSFYQNGDVYIRNNVAIATGLSTNTRIRVDVPENYYALEFVKAGVSFGGLHFNENIFQFGMAGITAFDFNSNGTSRIRVSTTGLVGVNTTNPNYTLDVNGIIRALGAIKLAPQVSGEYAQDATLSYYAAGNGVYLNGNNTGFLRLNADGNQHTNITLYGVNSSTASIIDFLTSANTRVRIDSTGKVLIGTVSTFTGDTLQVNGSILQRNTFNAIIRADSNGTLSAASQSDIMAVLGDSAYIKNQFSSAQPANGWINGNFVAGNYIIAGDYIKAGRAGFYGTYNYTQVQGIWSISEGYGISTANNDFGSQYGIVYGYEYGTTGTPKRPLTGYSHQILFVGNGVVYSAISMDTGKAFFNGYVGVGLSDATYYLDVVASIRLRNQSQIYFDTPSGASSNYIGITNSYWTTIYAGRGTTARIDLTNANGILFSTNTYERFRVEVDGKVLINTSSAYNGSVLQVNGSILQRNVIATSIVKILAADSNGTIVEADQVAVMGVLGDSAYIKNQNGSIQTGNFRINGTGRASEFYADAVGGNIYAAYGWLRNSYTQFYLYTYGNVNNDLRLARYNDVGGWTGNVFIVYRATGHVYFDNNVRIGGGEGATSYRLDVAETLRVGGQGGTDVTTIGGGSGVGSYLNMYYADGTVNNVLAGNGINALSSYLGGTIIGGFSYSSNNAKLIVRGSSMGNTATGTSSNRAVQISNTDIAYGLHFGVNSNGNSWIQSGRADSTQTYDLWLQHEGSSVIVGHNVSMGGFKLQVHGDIWSNGYVYLRQSSPSILLSDTDHRGGAIHVNSNTFYVLRLDDAGTSWATNNSGLWPLRINLENNDAIFGGAISQEMTKNTIVYANVNGTLTSATAQNIKDLLGDGAYIKNQFANAQAGAYFWIEQYARVGGYSTTGSTPRFSVTGDHSTTNFSLYSIGNGAGNDSSLDMWASEPGLTYDGCGIGHNINNSPYYGRRNTSQGQSYIRFYAGHVFISAASSERTNPSASTWIFNSNGIFYWGGSGGDKAQLTWDSGYAAVQSINGNRLLLGVAGADSSLMTLTTSAKVLIGTTAENSYKVNINGGGATYDGLYVNGHIRATGNIIADGYFSGTSSDRRYKSEFRPITVIDKIDKIDVSSYQHKLYGRRMIGSIAQDIEQLFPELVYQDDNKMYRLYDNGYAAIALQLGKEVKSEVDRLKERVQELEKQVEYLSK